MVLFHHGFVQRVLEQSSALVEPASRDGVIFECVNWLLQDSGATDWNCFPSMANMETLFPDTSLGTDTER